MNNLTVKSAAHDVDIGKNSDDLRKLERQRAEERLWFFQHVMFVMPTWSKNSNWLLEDNQRHKQDVDGIYEVRKSLS